MMANSFSVQVQSWVQAKPQARAVREKVFIVEQQVPRELEWDDWDEPSDHALAFDTASSAIGTGRLLPDGHIGRMAVLKDWRGKGVGAALLTALMKLAREKGMAELRLNAQTHAAAFYARFGFAQRGPEFMEAGIPHVEMTLRIAQEGKGGATSNR